MRYFSIFSGIEAASVAWGPIGWEPLVFSENDEFPCAVLAERYPDVPNLGDITEIDWKKAVKSYGKPGIVVGGSPCQSFSVAGSRTGLDGASGLMWEYVRCIREIKPGWLLWENVPGALSSSHGEDFRCLLRELDALGYGLAWRVLDAQFFGVAQRRERLFVVGSLGDVEGPCKVLFEPESLRWDSPSSKDKRKALAAGAGRRAEDSGGAMNPADPQSKRVFDPDGPAPTLSSGTGEGMNIQPSVLCAGFKWHQGSGAGSIGLEDEQSSTLTATMHKDPPVVAKTLKMRGGCEGGGKGPLVQEDVSATLGTGNDQTLFEPVSFVADCRNLRESEEVSGTLQAKSNGGYSLNFTNPVRTNKSGVPYAVRRLTPRECERLQGFPDDWTRVPYKGKPADECPDTPRYKAIGNSMAVNVMRWLGVRIDAVNEGENPDEACSRLRGQIFDD